MGNCFGKKEKKSSYIYILRFSDWPKDRYLIERTNELDKQMKIYLSQNSSELDVIYYSVSNSLLMEYDIHRQLDRYRLPRTREFYLCSIDKILNVCNFVTGSIPMRYRI